MADLSHVDLIGIDFSNRDLSFSDFSLSTLDSSDFSGADLSFANLSHSDLDNTNLQNADLRSATLRGASLSAADFKGADLEDADLSSADARSYGYKSKNPSNGEVSAARWKITDLTNAINLSQEQLDSMNGDEGTLIPDHLSRPKSWGPKPEPKIIPSLGIDFINSSNSVKPEPLNIETLTSENITAIWPRVEKLKNLARMSLDDIERNLPRNDDVYQIKLSTSSILKETISSLGNHAGQATLSSLNHISNSLCGDITFYPFDVDQRVQNLERALPLLSLEISDPMIIANLESVIASWYKIRPFYRELTKPFTSQLSDVNGLIDSYTILRDWICDAPTANCDIRIKEGIITLVQGLELVEKRSKVQNGSILLSEKDSQLIGTCLDTLPIILEALRDLGMNVKNGDADEWSNNYSSGNRNKILNVLDWAQRIDFTLGTGQKLGQVASWIKENWPI